MPITGLDPACMEAEERAAAAGLPLVLVAAVHPAGGPYVFIAERGDPEQALVTYPILGVADSTSFTPSRAPDYARPFEPQHWGVVEALIVDPDARVVSLQAPVPDGVVAPGMDAHHEQKHG